MTSMPAPGFPEIVSRTWQVMKGRWAILEAVCCEAEAVERCDVTADSLWAERGFEDEEFADMRQR